MKVHSQSAQAGQRSSDASGEPSERSSGHRKRCHTACTHCRTLRIKCSGTSPCRNCLSSGRQCDYEHSSGRVSHPQGEIDDAAAEPQPGYQKSPEMDMGVSYDESTTQYQTLPTPDKPLPSSPAAAAEAADIPSVDGTALVTDLSQQHIINPAEPYQDLSMLDLDVLPWSLLHENLYLPMEFDFAASSSLLGVPPERHATTAEHLPPQGLTIASHIAASTIDRRANIASASLFDESSQSASQTGTLPPFHCSLGTEFSINAILEAPSAHRVVRNLINYGLDYHEESNRTIAARDHASYWTSVSSQVASAFQIYSVQDPSTLLHHLVDLYFSNFEPLWPLFSPQNLNINQLHPLLFLVLTSIGAMYGDSACGQYGTMMHNQIRVCLAGPLELDDTDGDFTWLLQARSHTKVAALYFGQPKAFSFAQHLGALVVGQARRMDLFSSTYADTCERLISQPYGSASASDLDQRQTLWLHLEGRRRLAFAIFRAETYTSVLLQKKPLLTMQDISLTLPSCDAVWGSSEKLSARLCLEMIKHDRTPSRHLVASDIIHIALEENEPLPPLDASAYELLLFGLQSSIWRFSSDPEIFHRLTADPCLNTSAPPPPRPEATSTAFFGRAGAELNYLGSSSSSTRKMHDLAHDYTRLLCALRKCEAALPLVRAFVYTPRDRMSLMSSLILLHLGYLLLYTPINTLHQIQYLLADGKNPPFDGELVEAAYRWANSPRAKLAAERAVSIWALIASSGPPLEEHTGSRAGDGREGASKGGHGAGRDYTGHENGGQMLQFNLVAFLGLHHSAVLLWAYSGACEAVNTSGSRSGSAVEVAGNAAATAERRKTMEWGDDRPLLSLHAPRSPADVPIAINRDNASRMLQCFVWAYSLISPSRWSSFAKAATALSELPFPSRRC
ncbi:hypothetical protein BJY01DRAFT_236133 [Aspergillus pseudoustus]|uniref:Zn(2)-C6 fungal-type domain-containing protein n=1 Tax=Aspergillus pseudoustus TaxID=1810923 RepID=A0ABR4JSR0_9EURO